MCKQRIAGAGFSSKGGLWIPRAYNNFAKGALVFVIGGFNDKRMVNDPVKLDRLFTAVDSHVEWYLEFGRPLMFAELADGRGNDVDVLTNTFHDIAANEEAVFVQRLEWPRRGWADAYHLCHKALTKWLEHVCDVAGSIALQKGCNKVLFVTDSTFQAHDYDGEIYVTDQDLDNMMVDAMLGSLRGFGL